MNELDLTTEPQHEPAPELPKAVWTKSFNLKELDLTTERTPEPAPATRMAVGTKPFDLEENREGTRGDLARGLLYLLTFSIGGVLVFIGLGRLDGTVLTQSIFPSLIALAGTALGFYFGSQSNKDSGAGGGQATPQDK